MRVARKGSAPGGRKGRVTTPSRMCSREEKGRRTQPEYNAAAAVRGRREVGVALRGPGVVSPPPPPPAPPQLPAAKPNPSPRPPPCPCPRPWPCPCPSSCSSPVSHSASVSVETRASWPLSGSRTVNRLPSRDDQAKRDTGRVGDRKSGSWRGSILDSPPRRPAPAPMLFHSS